ncbi:hypothetical protein GCM10010517_41230 [Streptosporangium fragile]|uniref:Uncharacterized protein n=1 Tax=Streptosporangium fragile TaxID=46186 RepID=A0ABN3W0E2_9ACTN
MDARVHEGPPYRDRLRAGSRPAGSQGPPLGTVEATAAEAKARLRALATASGEAGTGCGLEHRIVDENGRAFEERAAPCPEPPFQ